MPSAVPPGDAEPPEAGTAEPAPASPLSLEPDVASTGASAAPTPEPGVTRRDRVTSLIEIVVCSGFPTQLLVVLVLSLLGMPGPSPAGQLSLSYITWLSAIDACLLVALCLVFLSARGESPSAVLLGARPPLGEARAGLLLVPVAFGLVILVALAIERLAPGLRNPQGNPLEALLKNPARIVVFAAVAMLAGGVREEVQRAFVLHRFERHLGGAAVGLVLFSIAFGLGHVIQGWDATILTGVLGAFWGLVYLRRRSIVAPAVCHALFNAIEVVYHGFAP